MAAQGNQFTCDFEIFGNLQGAVVRKFTEQQAKFLGLRGWCMNTAEGTIKGQIEGGRDQIGKLKEWLDKKGGPMAVVDKAVFTEIKEIKVPAYQEFTVRTQ